MAPVMLWVALTVEYQQYWEREVSTMNKCHVFSPQQPRGEDQENLNFWGNKPALPPLTTEAVVSVFYQMDDEL
jgi:hypothetical protein